MGWGGVDGSIGIAWDGWIDGSVDVVENGMGPRATNTQQLACGPNVVAALQPAAEQQPRVER